MRIVRYGVLKRCFIVKIGPKSSKKCLKLCIMNTSCVSLLLNDESLVVFLMCK